MPTKPVDPILSSHWSRLTHRAQKQVSNCVGIAINECKHRNPRFGHFLRFCLAPTHLFQQSWEIPWPLCVRNRPSRYPGASSKPVLLVLGTATRSRTPLKIAFCTDKSIYRPSFLKNIFVHSRPQFFYRPSFIKKKHFLYIQDRPSSCCTLAPPQTGVRQFW